MKMLNQLFFERKTFPTKIIQFGEGNFLRAFIDWQFDLLNEHTDFNSGITIVRPIDRNHPKHPKLDTQDGLYTTLIRGINEQGDVVSEPRVIQSVNREILAYQEVNEFLAQAENPELEWIVSNTTEAGIVFNDLDKLLDSPASTFPAKVTQFLLRRFNTFNGADDKGLIFLPCELIDYNGDKLKEIINNYIHLWSLDDEFKHWVNNANTFCSTLVDRIVTGYPKDEIETIEQSLGYQDKFLVTGEYFYLFVIQGPSWLHKKLKQDQFPLNIKIVDDISTYKQRKVGILNGAHTAIVPVAYMAGIDTVGEAMQDDEIVNFLTNLITKEVIPSINMDKEELNNFYSEVVKRFQNPYIKHQLLSISLNSFSKFKARNLPQLITYYNKEGSIPNYIVFSLSAMICFYQGVRNGKKINIIDDKNILTKIDEWKYLYNTNIHQLCENILGLSEHWELNLNEVGNLTELVTNYVTSIKEVGIKESLKQLME